MRERVNTYVLLCAVGLLILGSCSKETIELPVSNDPVFILDGTLSGEDFHLVAGDNNAYMHTNSEMINGVQLYSGDLSDGNFSVELGIFDGLVDKPGHVTIDELQNLTPTFAKRSEAPLVVLSKYMLGNNQNIQSIDWYINNSLAGAEEAIIREPGKYDVCAFITFNNGQFKSLCDEIIVGYKRSANCSIDFDVQQGVVVANVVNSVGSTITDVIWSLDEVVVAGNGTVLNSQLTSEVHTLRAEVHFNNGVVRTRTVLVDGSGGNNSVNDFSVLETTSTYSGPNQDFNIRLHIKANGKTYLSEYADNKNSTLLITGIEYYGKNDADKDVYKVSGVVDAVVMETTTEKMVSITFSTVFGVEIE